MDFLQVLIGLAIFVSVYFFVISGKIHRTIVAMLGGMLMILLKLVPQQKAFTYVDWNVIFLLIGMMIMVAVIGKTGLLEYISIKSAKIAKGDPYKIMVYMIFITAVFSAFLDNVTTVVFLAPISVLIARDLGVSPVPYLISEAIASNIGGTATLIGDPPNIMIGSAAHISFISFSGHVMPPIVIILFILPFLIKLLMKEKMMVSYERKARIMEFDESKLIQDKPLLKKTVLVLCLVIAGFFIHQYIDIEVATIAMLGAFTLILIMPRQKDTLRELLSGIEWIAIFFFIGFFIMVGGLQELGVVNFIAHKLTHIFKNNMMAGSIFTLWISGFISSVFDNIPFTATMIPIIKQIGLTMNLPAINPLWWALSLGACLGGNMTVIGAAANIFVVEISDKNGYPINFWEFARYGVLITIINLTVCSVYIWLRYFIIH